MEEKSKKSFANIYLRFNTQSIRGSATLNYLVFFIFLIVLTTFINYSWQSLADKKQEIIDVNQPINFHSTALLSKVKESQINLSQFILLNDFTYRAANRRLWLVTIPSFKDSLFYYINKSQNKDALVLYVGIGRQLAELKQIEEQIELIFQTSKNRNLLRQLLKSEIVLASKELESSVKRLNDIEKARQQKLEKTYLTELRFNNFLFIVLVIAGLIVFYFVGLYITLKIFGFLRETRRYISTMVKGNLPNDIKIVDNDMHTINKALNNLKQSLVSVKDYADSIKEGHFETGIIKFPVDSPIGNSLIEMGLRLKEVYEEDEQQAWSIAGLAKFSEILRNNSDNIEKLSRSVINELVRHLEVLQGGFFILEKNERGENMFNLKASFAYGKEKFIQNSSAADEGLLGRAFREKDVVYMTEIPEDYTYIATGLGATLPKALVIIPLVYEDEVLGVLELAGLNLFENYQIDFLKKLAESTASTLRTVATNQYNRQLLTDTQEASEMLKAQESMLRQNTFELSQAKETAENKLAKEKVNNKRYKAIIQNTEISIFFLDEKGSIQYANKAAAELTGYTSKKLLGENIKNLIPSYFSLYYQQFTSKGETDAAVDSTVELITSNKKTVNLYYQLAEVELDKEIFAILYLNKP